MIDMKNSLLLILDTRKYKFLKLKSFQSQADYLKKILQNYPDKYSSTIIKMEIRWREKIDMGEDYDSDRIRNYVNDIKSDQGKINYLRLVRKNINNQLLSHKKSDIFEFKGATSKIKKDALIIKSPNSELIDFISFYYELYSSKGVKLNTNLIKKLLSDRSFVLESMSKEIKNEIKYYKGKLRNHSESTEVENPKVQAPQPKNNKSNLKDDSRIDNLKLKIINILKRKDIKDEVSKKSADEKLNYMKQLLKKKFPNLTENQFSGSKGTFKKIFER